MGNHAPLPKIELEHLIPYPQTPEQEEAGQVLLERWRSLNIDISGGDGTNLYEAIMIEGDFSSKLDADRIGIAMLIANVLRGTTEPLRCYLQNRRGRVFRVMEFDGLKPLWIDAGPQ